MKPAVMETKTLQVRRARIPRAHPRVALPTDVEILAGEIKCMARVANVSVGGILVLCRDTFAPGTEVEVSFRLPGDKPVKCAGKVVHTRPSLHMAIKFRNLGEDVLNALSRFIYIAKNYVRRSGRLTRRLGVWLQWTDWTGQACEAMAETLTISRHGGQLICEARLKLGQEFYFWLLGEERGAQARVVYRVLGTAGDLVEIGFEFLNAEDFWHIDFPSDLESWPGTGVRQQAIGNW